MRKVIFQNLISLDGYYEGPNKELDWHNVDSEFNDFAIAFLNSIDTIMFGRVTYQMMAEYWPSSTAIKNDPVIAEKMNTLLKIVFSKSLKKAEWNNTRLINKNVPDEIKKLKQQSGKDIAIFGSSDLALSLIPHDLIDEFRIMVNPFILGNGKSLLKGLKTRLKLKLLNTKIFRSGNVLLYYESAKE
ncbi:MAG: dihydrofolate reductase family protein [Ignavibacteriaceae bacterium]|nr:dihydrofolate reductase family protein [Ignavibacteriaceae bacterium]